MRRTVLREVSFSGTGLHSGSWMRLRVVPNDQGLRVISGSKVMTADYANVRPSRLCTLLASPDDPSFTLSTVEHLMSALYAVGVTDADLIVDGPEVPILDGSAAPFFEALRDAGTRDLDLARRQLIITRPVRYADGNAEAWLLPADGFSAEFRIEFANPAIGAQSFAYDPRRGGYAEEIARARTFCMEADVRAMRASGLALGGGMGNAVVFGEGRVLNPEGLRFRDEPVRHKLLDALGDLHLANAEIVGKFVGVRSGHLMTNMLLRAAFSQEIVVHAEQEAAFA